MAQKSFDWESRGQFRGVRNADTAWPWTKRAPSPKPAAPQRRARGPPPAIGRNKPIKERKTKRDQRESELQAKSEGSHMKAEALNVNSRAMRRCLCLCVSCAAYLDFRSSAWGSAWPRMSHFPTRNLTCKYHQHQHDTTGNGAKLRKQD